MNKNEFLKKWKAMVWQVARTIKRSYRLSEEDCEDIVQSVTLKLAKLTPQQRKMPDVWVRTVINNGSRDALRQILRWEDKTVSIDANISNDKENNSLADLIADPEDTEEAASQKILISQLLSRCDNQARQIISLHLGLGGTRSLKVQQIAKRLKLRIEDVERTIEAGIEIMREAATVRTYKCLQSVCRECSETELLLVPLSSRIPDQSVCMACDRLTDCHCTEQPITA